MIPFGFTGLSLESRLNFSKSLICLFCDLRPKNPFAISLIVPSPPMATIFLYPFRSNLRVINIPSLDFFVKMIL
jgi:hypothetical protein